MKREMWTHRQTPRENAMWRRRQTLKARKAKGGQPPSRSCRRGVKQSLCHSPQKKWTPPTPWSQPSSLQNCEETFLLSPPVCVTLLQPQKTDRNVLVSPDMHGTFGNSKRISVVTTSHFLLRLHLFPCHLYSNTIYWASTISEHFSLGILVFPGKGKGNPLQCSCLENPMDRGACWATVYGIPKSRTRIRDVSIHNSLNLIHHCYQHLLDEEKLRLSELKRLSGLNTTLWINYEEN